ncbi:LAS1-like protein [Glycine soja]|nr:LAS1-like protein [Glycine soja]
MSGSSLNTLSSPIPLTLFPLLSNEYLLGEVEVPCQFSSKSLLPSSKFNSKTPFSEVSGLGPGYAAASNTWRESFAAHSGPTRFKQDCLQWERIPVDESNDASLSEEMLAMLYCMAIMRLVNGVVEKTRKKEVTSIAVAADAIGIPRMLIDIRHGEQSALLFVLLIAVIAEGSHRELPSLKIVRSASVKALDWLKSYYWEPQSKAIPFHGEGIANVKKEIKSKIRELAICLKVNGSAQSSSSLLKAKRLPPFILVSTL